LEKSKLLAPIALVATISAAFALIVGCYFGGDKRTIDRNRVSIGAAALTNPSIDRGVGPLLIEILWEGRCVVAAAPMGKPFSKVYQGFLDGC